MSTEIQTTNKVIVCLDASELEAFEACTLKWHLVHHLNLRPKVTKSYLDKGTLIHYLLELYYKNLNQANIEDIVEAGRMKALEFDLSLEDVSEHIFQFREYVRFYSSGEDSPTETIIPLHIEEPFMVKLHEDDHLIVYISGKPDLIFRYANSPDPVVMDHKRVTRDSNISILRNQFLLYATAIGTDTVIVNKIGFQKTYKPKDRFKRVPYVYNKEILEEWKHEVIGRAREMVIAQTYENYPHNRSSCEKWDGCWYQRYCSTRPSAREFLIGSEYIVSEPWDVTKKLEEIK